MSKSPKPPISPPMRQLSARLFDRKWSDWLRANVPADDMPATEALIALAKCGHVSALPGKAMRRFEKRRAATVAALPDYAELFEVEPGAPFLDATEQTVANVVMLWGTFERVPVEFHGKMARLTVILWMLEILDEVVPGAGKLDLRPANPLLAAMVERVEPVYRSSDVKEMHEALREALDMVRLTVLTGEAPVPKAWMED